MVKIRFTNNDMALPKKCNRIHRYRLWLVVMGTTLAAFCFIRFHTPYADTGVLAGIIKCGLADWQEFMRDVHYAKCRWFFGKPIYLLYTLLYKFVVPFRYEVLPACLLALIGLNGYLAKRIFAFFFEPKTSSLGAIVYVYLLFVAYWLCPLRNEIYLMTIMCLVLLNSLRFHKSERITLFYVNIVLVCCLGVTIHPNSFYLVLYLFFFFVAFKIYRTHLWSSVFLTLLCTLVGLAILLWPSLTEFQANIKYLATRDGERFLLGLKFFQIVGAGFYKNGYQYPLVVSALALSILNFRALVSFFKRPSPAEKILVLYMGALVVHFLFVPSANWKVYSVHFLFPLAFWLTYVLDGDRKTQLNAPMSLAVCILLMIPVVREYHFLDKAGVLIPCSLFLLFVILNRFRITRKLILATMFVFVCVHVFQLYTNHKWYRRMSAVLTQTGETCIVTSSIFEFLGVEYDIRLMSRAHNFAGLAESHVMLLDRVQFERSGLTRAPDQYFRFNNHFIPGHFIPRIYQEWFLFLPRKTDTDEAATFGKLLYPAVGWRPPSGHGLLQSGLTPP